MTNRDLTNAIVEAVAKGLTPAMRRDMLWLPSDGSWRTEDRNSRFSALINLAERTVCAGVKAEIAEYDTPSFESFGPTIRKWRLTKLGLRVRVVVEKMEREEAA